MDSGQLMYVDPPCGSSRKLKAPMRRYYYGISTPFTEFVRLMAPPELTDMRYRYDNETLLP